ncbi:MAG: HU family DNA-binding protein [Chloroflexota bacterium]|nr:HU family DNA-binding protein [Chloroflexota bacterium]
MADRPAAWTGLSKSAAKEVVDGVFAAIGDALANGEAVRIAGFGTFGTRSPLARTGPNPRTGEAVSISASSSPTFKARKTLKDAVNAGPGS